MLNYNRFSQKLNTFYGLALPEKDALLAGYGALINAYDLQAPLPEKLSIISSRHRRYEIDNWKIFTPRHMPESTLTGHLIFALKYEGFDLSILNALFRKINQFELESWINSEPLGQYSRRIWFIYEWLTGEKLKVEDLNIGNYIDLLDPNQYYVIEPSISKRHRIRNNLPGVVDYCPLIRKTDKLEHYIKLNISDRAKETTGNIHPDILRRAAAFLLLKDTMSSFAIEGETPGKNRTDRWGYAVEQAGYKELTIDELIRLQQIIISDTRFVKLGLRSEGGFIGTHDRINGTPIPEHISAKWQDLPKLLAGLIEAEQLLRNKSYDAVLTAASIAFGLVFIHPFVDGNGRLHRYLIHHVLADHGFTPKGIIFPVSAIIYEKIDEYSKVLKSYSRPRLKFQEWEPTSNGNIEVLNNTIDLYRYFDATKQAEFLYECVFDTVTNVFPAEIRYLNSYDKIKHEINNIHDMPDYLVDLLIRFLFQNKGTLSKRAKEKEFRFLTSEEILALEALYKDIFSDDL